MVDSDIQSVSQLASSSVSTPGGNIIRDVTAAEATTLGLTSNSIVIYGGPTAIRGIVIVCGTSNNAGGIFRVNLAAGVITGVPGALFEIVNNNLTTLLSINGTGAISFYNALATAAGGASAFRGIDDRNTVTSTDGAPITVYAVPATTGKFRITVTLVGRAGTVTSAIYTFKYTVAATVITDTVSISAVDTDASKSIIVLPDLSTNITGQLTTLTGASASVDITCLVEAVGAGT